MSRKLVWLAALVCSAASLESAAQAQIIIFGRDFVREREDYFSRVTSDWVKAYLGRKPSEKELAILMQRIRTGTDPLVVQATILSSDEYFKKHGSNTQGFINGLFADVLGRKATKAEILQLQAKANGMGRARFAAEFLTATQGPLVGPTPPTTIIIP
jgi:hypothetical protein